MVRGSPLSEAPPDHMLTVGTDLEMIGPLLATANKVVKKLEMRFQDEHMVYPILIVT